MALHWISSPDGGDWCASPAASRADVRFRLRTWWIVAAAIALLGFAAIAHATAAAAAPVRLSIPRVQIGYATFLASSFHGDETASGEIFDRRKLVAAHRTLPFGTRVRINNLENGRSVDVRIVDRGPYGQNWREGTIIDVSRAAARRLGMVRDGQVRVRVTVLRLGEARAAS